MTVAMCLTWLVLFYFTALAFMRGKIFTASPEETLRDTRLKRPDLEMALFANTAVGVGVVSVVNEHGVRETRMGVMSPPPPRNAPKPEERQE